MHPSLDLSPDAQINAQQAHQLEQQREKSIAFCQTLIEGRMVGLYNEWEAQSLTAMGEQVWERIRCFEAQYGGIDAISIFPVNEDGDRAIYFFALLPYCQGYLVDLLPFSIVVQREGSSLPDHVECHCQHTSFSASSN